MRILRKTIVLALAAFGAYRAWELLSPRLAGARDRSAARGRSEPAWSNAQESVEETSRAAAASLATDSRDAADATTATVDLTREESNASGAAPAQADSSRGPASP